jgi:hypothetical protein
LNQPWRSSLSGCLARRIFLLPKLVKRIRHTRQPSGILGKLQDIARRKVFDGVLRRVAEGF